jgi:AcrR family transcriptional regulator
MTAQKTSTRWGTIVPTLEDQFQNKRRALIREAGKAFSRFGYRNTSLDDIAKVLNVTKPALYYYVKDKNEILFECHNLALDLGDLAIEEARSSQETAFSRLRHFILRYVEMINSELGNYAVLTEPVTSLRNAERDAILERRRGFDALLREWVAEAIRDGDIADADPRLVVAFFMGAVNHIPIWFNPDGPTSGKDVAALFTNLISYGMQGAAKKPRDRSRDE